MSPLYYRRGRNWFTAIGVLFVVIGLISIVRQLVLWQIEIFFDAIINSDVTSEKVAIGTIAFGSFMIIYGYKKKHEKTS